MTQQVRTTGIACWSAWWVYPNRQSTVSKILSQKVALKHNAVENKAKDHKRKRTGKADNVEQADFTWFTDVWARDVPVTTSILEKSKQFATAWTSLISKLQMSGYVAGRQERDQV